MKNLNIWQAEPAMVIGLVTAVLALVVSFGIPVSQDQRDAIVGVVSAVLILIGAVVVRANVYPAAKIEGKIG